MYLYIDVNLPWSSPSPSCPPKIGALEIVDERRKKEMQKGNEERKKGKNEERKK
jgi:hypothetical protein